MSRHIIILIIAFALTMLPHSATGAMKWHPLVSSYEHPSTGRIYSTWRIASDNGWTYFATQTGLLEYDGIDWKAYHLNNKSDVRGVMILHDLGAIMVGGENEFGKLTPDSSGQLRYTCLSDSLPSDTRTSMGNAFDFYQYDGLIYARCDFMVAVISHDTMRYVASDDKIFASTMRNGTLYIATDRGLYMLAGDRFMPAQGTDDLSGKHINAILPYNDGLLIATATDGLYYYDFSNLSRFSTGFDPQLRDDIVSCAAINGSCLAVGTVRSGLWVHDFNTGDVSHLDVNNGACSSDMVQSVTFDQSGNLWIGHDLGLDYVYLNHPYTLLYNDFVHYGVGNTALVADGSMYFGTNRALYQCRYDTTASSAPILTPVGGTDLIGTAWHLYRHHDGELLLMHGKGIYTIKDNHARRNTDIIGAWTCLPVSGHDNSLWIGAYQGIYLIDKENGRWINRGRVNGINEACRYFSQHDDTLMVYNRSLGIVTPYLLDSAMNSATQLEPRKADYDYGTAISRTALHEWNVTNDPLHLDSTHIIIPFNRGFMLYDLNDAGMMDRPVHITTVMSVDPDSVYYRHNFAGIRNSITADATHSVLSISYGVPAVAPHIPCNYQHRLNGGEWSAPSGQTSIILSHLAPGEYTFEVRAFDDNISIASTDSITFRILPPWYRTWWAYALYAILILTIITVISVYERSRRSSRNAIAEKNNQMDSMKEDLVALRHKQMEQELQHKSREIANLTINMARKNEILINLKEDIHNVRARLPKESSATRQSLLLINNKIDANIEDDDILKRFEQQFDLAHNNYMSRLRRRHPDLTLKERLLCAYIKMNLSSKEIASLMNISLRGIESIRYRMRKKLGLEADASLIRYLDSIDDTES